MVVLMMGGASTISWAQSGFEAEPVLKAKDLVAPELLKGPNFTVDERVPVVGFLARFTVRSEFGTFDVHGIHMLQVRVPEVWPGPARQDEQVQGIRRRGGQGGGAPGRVRGQYDRQPGRDDRGLARRRVAPLRPDQAGRRVDRGRRDRIRARPGSRRRPGSRSAWAASRWMCSASRRSGGTSPRALGVDPYTSNPVLSQKLTDMAWVAFSGRFGHPGGMAVVRAGLVGGVGGDPSRNSSVYDTPPGDLINAAQAIFAQTGASDDAGAGAPQESPVHAERADRGRTRASSACRASTGFPSVIRLRRGGEDAGRDPPHGRHREHAGPLSRGHAAHRASDRAGSHHRADGHRRAAGPRPRRLRRVDPASTARLAQRDDLKAPQRTASGSPARCRRARASSSRGQGWTVFESFTIAAER